jgi:hypothetical protein
MFHVVLHRSGPEWDAARPLEEQAESSDPLSGSHLVAERIEPWPIRLDARAHRPSGPR